ncbi:unnamed protein product, partial [Ilex paraguariensis]
HIKQNFSTLKKSYKKEKKVGMKATWSDSDSDSDPEETKETANLCFMAMQESDEVKSKPKEEIELTINEMYDAILELHNDLLDITKRHKELKKKLVILSKENNILKIENEKLMAQNVNLKKESQESSLVDILKKENNDLRRMNCDLHKNFLISLKLVRNHKNSCQAKDVCFIKRT